MSSGVPLAPAGAEGRRAARAAGRLAALGVLALPLLPAGTPPAAAEAAPACAASPDPEYYSFELVGTDKVAAVQGARGRATVSRPPSPFGLAVTRDGTIAHRVEVSVQAPEAPGGGTYVAWAADPNLERIVRLGEVRPGGAVSGEVVLNKFMVFVTLEDAPAAEAERWRGPVVLVGRSRSARIQSMASHGSFEAEPC